MWALSGSLWLLCQEWIAGAEGRSRETSQEAVSVVLARYVGGLDQGDSSGGGEKCGLGYPWKGELTGSPERLNEKSG